MISICKLFFALLVVNHLKSSMAARKKTRLMIGGFAGINIHNQGWSSSGVIPAIELALERINLHTDILRDYHLAIDWKDTQCASGYAIKGLVELISETPHKISLLGPACSIAAYPIAEALPFWNLTQISFSLTAPSFSNVVKYPNMYRVNPSETIHDPAILALVNRFQWKSLVIIKHELRVFNEMAENLQMILLENQKEVPVIGFVNNATNAIEKLKERDSRIIIFLMYEKQARQFICSAFHSGLYGNHIVWIIRGWYQPYWWKTALNDVGCTVEQIESVLINVLATDHVYFGDIQDTTVAGLTKPQYLKEYEKLLKKKNDTLYFPNLYNTYGFDAILMLAAALNKTEKRLERMNQSLRDFSYSRHDITEMIKEEIARINSLNGLTGTIKLDKHGDRIVNVWLQQMQDYQMQNIGLYYTENNTVKMLLNKSFSWRKGLVPLDRKALKKVVFCVSGTTFIIITTTCACCILMAVYFFWINIKNGRKRFLKMSSPPLNNFLILGACIAYLNVILNVKKSCSMKANTYNSNICKIENFLLSVSFSLMFGTIFLKTWRIYKIFTNAKLCKELRFLSNKHLMVMILLMVVFDVIYFLAWNIIDPLRDTLFKVDTNKLIMLDTIYYIRGCDSQYLYYWFLDLVAYKGLLILFCVFLTWETRNVSFPGLNDSKYIGLCVYNMAICGIVVIPIIFFTFRKNVDISFGAKCGGVVYCVTITLLLMFLPKIFHSEISQASTGSTPSTLDGINSSEISPRPNATSLCPLCKR